MITSWIKYVNRFGPLAGTRLFYQVRYLESTRLTVPTYQTTFQMRPNSSDGPTFEQVLVDEEYQLDRFLSRLGPIRTIVDAGANVGYTSLYFAKQYPEAQIVAIEPDAANTAILKAHTISYPKVKILQTGLWHRPSSLRLVDEGYGHYGFMVEEVPDGSPNSFSATSLTAIMEENNWQTIDLLKLDVEGSEKEIFSADFAAWLPKTRCLFVELHDRKRKGASKAVFQAINQYDFSVSIQGELLLFINEDLAVHE